MIWLQLCRSGFSEGYHAVQIYSTLWFSIAWEVSKLDALQRHALTANCCLPVSYLNHNVCFQISKLCHHLQLFLIDAP
jgi:hypothetical protein